jgi:hypothetical protein
MLDLVPAQLRVKVLRRPRYAQLRQSYWEVSRKPLISRGETDEILGFPGNVVPFIATFLA